MSTIAMVGFVTSEEVVRTWTREGSQDWWVEDPDGLRRLLGAGRVDRARILPGAYTEMVVLDDDEATMTVSAPFEPQDGGLFPLAGPFRLARVVSDLTWSASTLDVFVDWVADRLDRSAARGEALYVQEQGRGPTTRSASAQYMRSRSGWVGTVATSHLPEGDEQWARGGDDRGGGLLAVQPSSSSSTMLATLLAGAVLGWPEGPLGLVTGWDAAPDGPFGP